MFVQHVLIANGVLPGDPGGNFFIRNICRGNLLELALAGFFFLISTHVFTQHMSRETLADIAAMLISS